MLKTICTIVVSAGVSFGATAAVALGMLNDQQARYQSHIEELKREEAPRKIERNTIVVQVDNDVRKDRITWRNNPGNVKGKNWNGQIGVDDQGHAVFAHPNYGIRAMAITLMTYQRKYNLHTLEAIIDKYCEANKKEYVAFLCRATGLKPDQKFRVVDYLPELIKAMIIFETGKRDMFTDEDFILLSVYQNL